jgi:hypothetical protein
VILKLPRVSCRRPPYSLSTPLLQLIQLQYIHNNTKNQIKPHTRSSVLGSFGPKFILSFAPAVPFRLDLRSAAPSPSSRVSYSGTAAHRNYKNLPLDGKKDGQTLKTSILKLREESSYRLRRSYNPFHDETLNNAAGDGQSCGAAAGVCTVDPRHVGSQ